MCEQTEVRYLDGDVVWVKLGSCWWPGSVKDVDQLPEEILVSLKKKPIAAVKFFQEETFEYVRNLNQICMYNCRRKNEFIKKGLDIYRTRRREGSSVMDKFPDDVSTAEKLTGGDPDILRDEAFAPEERPDYRNIFGGDNKRACSPDKKNKSISPKVNWKVSSANGRRSQTLSPALNVLQQPRQITHPRFISEVKDDSDHVVRIRQQPSSTPSRDEQGETPIPQYKCHQCDFTSNRLNVIVLHNKFHTADAANNGRSASNKGGSTIKSKSAECKVGNRGKSRISTSSPSDRSRARSKTVPATNETPTRAESAVDRSAPKRKLIDASENEKTKEESSANSKSQSPKTPEKQFKSSEKKTPKMPIFGKRKITKGSSDKPAKKKKNDEEIREKLLADWDEEDEEQEEKEIELIKQELSKSELSSSPSTNLTPSTPSTMGSSQSESTSETKEETTKPKITSCFDFDDSEDANLGIELEERAKKFVENRKIPRILEDKSEPVISKRRSITDDIKPITPSETSNSKVDESEPTVAESLKEELDLEKTDETLSVVPDTEDMDVAFKTLLDETTVPALPEVPELPIAKVASPPPEVGSSASLPDVVLDSNNSETNSSTSCLPEVTSVENTGGGDHDYSIKTEIEIVEEQPMKTETEETLNLPKEDVSEQIEQPAQATLDDDEMELDINSMPVVMTDAIITDEPESKSPVVSMPMVDLIPKTEPSESFVLSEYKPNINIPSTLVTTVASIVSPTTPPETVVAVSKSTVVVSTQIPSSSGSSVVKAPIKTVKLQAATSSTAATLSTIGKLKGTAGATVLSQKGPGGGKLVIVQASPGQQSRYTVGKSAQQRVTVKAAQQQIVQQGVGGGKVVILTKSQTGGQQKILTAALSPQQQRILTTSGKLQTQTQPQRIISSTGAILTPINPRSVMAKGTKLTPITQQQMRALQGGKQTLGAKFTMQSTQAKVILPSMQKATVSQTSPVRVIGTLKPQTNTILIQTTQGTTVSGTVVGKSIASTSGQIQPKITTTQTIAKLANSKPKILTSSGVASTIQRISIPTTLTGKTIQTAQVQQKVVGIRTAVAPRMVMQKIQSPVAAKAGSVGLLTNVSQVKKVSGVFQRASPQKITQPGNQTQILHKIGTTQSVQKIVTPQQLKKATITQQKVADVSVQGSKCIPIVVSATNLQANAEAVTTQPLPSLQPLQPNVTVAPAMQSSNLPLSSSHSNVATSIPGALPSLQPASTTTPVLMSEQIAQVVAATPTEQLGDGSTATYVLVTIDDSGALQPYENSTLLSYDGGAQTSEGAARTLYIDPSSISSSGDLENIILTIDNSASNSGAVLNLGQTNALPVSPATTIAVENSTSSVFNIGPSHASAPQSSGTNQDILAEALANTQVFQPDNTIQDSLTVVNSNRSTVMTPRLLESSILTSTPSTLHQTTMLLPSLSTVLPPPNPAGVLETSLTLNQPIMTPLEVPSSAVPTLQVPPPVPSSLELPLTITQPALSVTSQSYPSLPATTPSPSSTPSSSLSLIAPVSAGSFNPSMPLLSEETDSQTEININIGEQQSVIPPISVSEEIQSQEDIIYNEDTGSTVQEKASSHVETLLTSAQAAQSQSTLSYENTSENAPLEKEPISKDSLELDQSSSTCYQKSDLVDAEPQVEEATLTSDQQVSLLVENNRTDESIERPTSAPNGVSDQCYSNTDHSSSDHIDPGHNSLNNIGFSNVENPSPLEGPTPASEALFAESSDVSELAVQQKSDVDQPSYESSTDDSQLQINNDSARAEETSENDSYLPVSDNTVSVEDTVAASSSSDQNPCNIFLEVADDSRVVQTESNNLNPYSGVQDNVSESLPDISESQQPVTSQSMPLLVDEPMTETDVEEKSSLKEPQPALNNDVEMNLEQNER